MWTQSIRLPDPPLPGEDAVHLDSLTLPCLVDMKACEQDPIHHAEGNVLVHTQMVCDALVADLDWQALPELERQTLWLAALLHDIGKPAVTREEDGRLRAPGHAGLGAIMARRILWQADIDPLLRENVCRLVHWHMAPYHLLHRSDAERRALAASCQVSWRHLMILVRADSRGRTCSDKIALFENLDLVEAYCGELTCLESPYAFASDHSRVEYFRKLDRDPTYAAFDDTRCDLTLLCGLPGTGKDRWVSDHGQGQIHVSLDNIRRSMGSRRGDAKAQGQVIQAAKQMLREALGPSQHVIWNATNLSAQQRAPILGLAADYNARVKVVCLEAQPHILKVQNADRTHALPEAAIESLLRRWDPPTLVDAHEINVVKI